MIKIILKKCCLYSVILLRLILFSGVNSVPISSLCDKMDIKKILEEYRQLQGTRSFQKLAKKKTASKHGVRVSVRPTKRFENNKFS